VPPGVAALGAVVSLAAAVIGLFFTAMVFRLFLERRKPHHVAWTTGLAMFTAVAIVQVVAELGGWTDGLFRTWYLLGAGGLVGFLGLGSVYIVNRRAGHGFAAYVVALFVAFVAATMTAPTDAGIIGSFNEGVPVSGDGWVRGSLPRLLSPLLNIPAGIALIGLAVVGLVRYRLTYNGWIAVGATVQALGTGISRFRDALLASGIDTASLIYFAELAGIALMFVGFWKAVEWAKEHRTSAHGGGPPPTRSETDQVVADTVPK